MRVHLCEGADLGQVDVLTVAQGHDLVKGKDEVEAVLGDLTLLQHAAVLWDLQVEKRRGDRKEADMDEQGIIQGQGKFILFWKLSK